MERINLKPLSLNHAYRGRRFATKELTSFKTALGYLLPKKTLPRGLYSVTYEFGVSCKAADGDNLIKCFQDALADKYGFNDKDIYEWHIRKLDVPKGKEYCAFEIALYRKKLDELDALTNVR